MHKMTRALLLLLIAVSIAACVNDPQDIPPVLESKPVFFADLIVDHEPVTLTAGHDGYVLQTDHFTDGEGITHYISTFASESCAQEPCPVLEFEFFDNQIVSQPKSGVAFTFIEGLKDYFSAELDGELEISFFLGQNQFEPGLAYWTTGTDTAQITTSDVQITVPPNEYFDLCFYRSGDTLCEGLASYCFHTLATSPFVGVLKADRMFGEYILIEMDLQGNEPYTYHWMNSSNTSFILVPAEDGVVDVNVEVTDATQSRINVSQTIRISNGDAKMCGGSPLFVYSITKAPFAQFSSVALRYTDDMGRLLSTSFGPQPSSLFEITGVSEFGLSPEGKKTKLLTLTINGIFYSADQSVQIPFEAGDVVIAISYD
jgi:hypothetical protein